MLLWFPNAGSGFSFIRETGENKDKVIKSDSDSSSGVQKVCTVRTVGIEQIIFPRKNWDLRLRKKYILSSQLDNLSYESVILSMVAGQ